MDIACLLNNGGKPEKWSRSLHVFQWVRNRCWSSYPGLLRRYISSIISLLQSPATFRPLLLKLSLSILKQGKALEVIARGCGLTSLLAEIPILVSYLGCVRIPHAPIPCPCPLAPNPCLCYSPLKGSGGCAKLMDDNGEGRSEPSHRAIEEER